MISTLLSPYIAQSRITNPQLSDVVSDYSPSEFFSNLVPRLINIALVVGALAFLFYLFLGGIQWATSQGNKMTIEEARRKITHALAGMVILFSFFIVIQLVNQAFGVDIGGLGPANQTVELSPPEEGDYSGLETFTFQRIVTAAVQAVLVGATILFLIMLLIGGLRWTSSQGDKAVVESARHTLTNAITGLVIVFSIFVLIYSLNFVFGTDIGDLGTGPGGGEETPTSGPEETWIFSGEVRNAFNNYNGVPNARVEIFDQTSGVMEHVTGVDADSSGTYTYDEARVGHVYAINSCHNDEYYGERFDITGPYDQYTINLGLDQPYCVAVPGDPTPTPTSTPTSTPIPTPTSTPAQAEPIEVPPDLDQNCYQFCYSLSKDCVNNGCPIPDSSGTYALMCTNPESMMLVTSPSCETNIKAYCSDNIGATSAQCCCSILERNEVTCDDGIDNDNDGYADCLDIDCEDLTCGVDRTCSGVGNACCGALDAYCTSSNDCCSGRSCEDNVCCLSAGSVCGGFDDDSCCGTLICHYYAYPTRYACRIPEPIQITEPVYESTNCVITGTAEYGQQVTLRDIQNPAVDQTVDVEFGAYVGTFTFRSIDPENPLECVAGHVMVVQSANRDVYDFIDYEIVTPCPLLPDDWPCNSGDECCANYCRPLLGVGGLCGYPEPTEPVPTTSFPFSPPPPPCTPFLGSCSVDEDCCSERCIWGYCAP